MSKTVKNILIIFTLLCLVVLVVFVIELIVINRESADSGGSGQALAGTTLDQTENSQDVPAETPTGGGSSSIGSGTVNGNSNSNSNNQQEGLGQPPAPTGKRYELVYSQTETLVIYADEELFEYDPELEMAYKFTYKGEGTASLLISFTALPLGAQRHAENFLDGDLDGNESHVSGEGSIRRSSLSGVLVTGVKGAETYEAWIHSIPDGDSDPSNDIGLAFVIQYSSDEQKNAIYTILDSLSLIPV